MKILTGTKFKSFFLQNTATVYFITALLCITPLSALGTQHHTLGFLVSLAGLGDQSYNDMAYAGLFKAKQQYNLKLILEDSEKSELAFDAAMQRLLDKGATLVVANGFYMKEVVRKYATLYPRRYFILQDATLSGLGNVVSIRYSMHEGSFLAGALAGLMTITNRVGFIGGVDIPIMHNFRLGFKSGVEFTNPCAAIREEFVTKAPDYSGFQNPSEAYNMAMEAFEAEVDIIFAAAGLSGNGVMQAAKKTGKYAIGVDSDQDHLAKGFVLTSMMKRLDIATFKEVSKIVNGSFVPGVKQYGLSQKGVGLSPMKYTRHLIPDEVYHQVTEIEHQIINGTIQVPNYLDRQIAEKKEAGR